MQVKLNQTKEESDHDQAKNVDCVCPHMIRMKVDLNLSEAKSAVKNSAEVDIFGWPLLTSADCVCPHSESHGQPGPCFITQPKIGFHICLPF